MYYHWSPLFADQPIIFSFVENTNFSFQPLLVFWHTLATPGATYHGQQFEAVLTRQAENLL
jgi:hypothetical protein